MKKAKRISFTIFINLVLFTYIEPEDIKYWPTNQGIAGSSQESKGLSNEECVQRIYRDCNQRKTFTDEELENVRQFLNYSFSVLADIKPDKPLCPKLHVRHDWKCLSEQQKTAIINVWKEMYERGDVQRLTDMHVKFYPAWHKAGEFNANHRWLINQFEMIMRTYDPRVTLPYWDPTLYGTQPERSSVWDVLGHSGNYSNGYCVRDGIYHDWGLTPCVKRHWSPRDTIYPLFTPEVTTAILQSSNIGEIGALTTGQHFEVHTNIGGYEGQYSYRNAPYDLIFFMHHMSQEDIMFLKWQLQEPHHLTPLDYNLNNWKFNSMTGAVERADFATDFITGPQGVTVREMFWVGFGDLCYISDQLIQPINEIWRGIHTRETTAIKRLKALPKWILERYYPRILSGNYTGLHYHLEEVGECNTRCVPLPKPAFLYETEAGRLQLQAFSYDNGVEYISYVVPFEQFWYQFWKDMNAVGYCSPYVTTY